MAGPELAAELRPLLWTLPSIIFLLLTPIRLWNLRHASIKVHETFRGHTKTIIGCSLLLAQVLALIAQLRSLKQINPSLIYDICSVLATFSLCILSSLEHHRSIRPSDLIVFYLIISAVCDAVQPNIFSFPSEIQSKEIILIIILILKLVLLVPECQGKGRILKSPFDRMSPEETSGIIGSTLFVWINPILLHGSRTILTNEDVPPLDTELSSRKLRKKILRSWDQRDKPESKLTLMKVLLRCLAWPLISAVLPRLFLIGFRYAQPFLIKYTIRYTQTNEQINNSSMATQIVLFAIIVYTGLAISTAIYEHRLNRLSIMIRGAVVGLIYNNSLIQPESQEDGRAVTLMSTDTDSLCQSAEMLHETWAQVVEVIIGMAMLWGQVGWLWPVPLVIIFFCSRVSRHVAQHLHTQQKDWNRATQTRISMLTSVLGSMKEVKMLGFSNPIKSKVQSLRLEEMEMAAKVRSLNVVYNASANALGIFSPAITLVLFAIMAKLEGSALDTETAFTSIAILGMITHPANMIMTIIPKAVGVFASFERIQQYLMDSPRRDLRQVFSSSGSEDRSSAAIRIENMTVLNSSTSQPILDHINLTIASGSIAICSGLVGSGKTTLARAILGDVPPNEGMISVASKRIGYCAQSPWLASGTVKEAITGYSAQTLDAEWYNNVIDACCLTEDIRSFPDGHETMIGSRGNNLSGGQRHRVALARAIYARSQIIVLDDSFSALDGKTEQRVVENLIGPQGLFRTMKTTVVLITNSAQHFSFADWIVILEHSQIVEQGPPGQLKHQISRLSKAILKDNPDKSKGLNVDPPSKVLAQRRQAVENLVDLSRKTGDLRLYGYYLKSFGYRKFLLMVAFTASNAFFITFPQYWLKWWTEAGAQHTWVFSAGYLSLSTAAWASTSCALWATLMLIAPQSGSTLHYRLLTTIAGAPLSYFSTTDTGNILNRFSQDMNLIDRHLPIAFLTIFIQTFKLLMQVALFFSVQASLIISLPIYACIVYILQKIYLQTSRQLRLLELESQSYLYLSFIETIEGIATVRSFGWQKESQERNTNYLETSQRPSYLLLCLQRWLNLVCDLLIAALAIGFIVMAVKLKTTTGGEVGVALNIVLVANVTLLRLVTSWTRLETSLGAVARLKNLERDTPQEDQAWEDTVPPAPWPTSGEVEFKDTTVAYNSKSIALKDIDLTIRGGQKLMICGRTGSGKSTLILTLLRLVEIKSGLIQIDGFDIATVPRSYLRETCFIAIPQSPLLIGQASLRFNLDPTGRCSNLAIVEALKATQLWTHYMACDANNNLNYGTLQIESDEELVQRVADSSIYSLKPMSTGQLQLFSLARAIIKADVLNKQLAEHQSPIQDAHQTKPIVLLDEATSSLDAKTESIVHDIIDAQFTKKGHTVIAVAHRISRSGQETPERELVAWMAGGTLEKVGPAKEVLESGVSNLGDSS